MSRGASRSALLAFLASATVVAALAVVILRPGKEETGRKETDAVRKKRASRPADVDLVIEVRADGTVWCWGEQVTAGTAADSGGAGEAEEGTENLRRLLSQLTQDLGSERDEKGRELSEARVRVECVPGVNYEVVQKILRDCMAANIRDLRFGEAVVRVPEEEELKDPPVFRGGFVIEMGPDEVRVKIWTPRKGVVQMSLDERPCRDADDLARGLADYVANDPNRAVVIDSRMKVPFGRVLEAVEACRRAGMKTILFQAPPILGGGGEDWWYQ